MRELCIGVCSSVCEACLGGRACCARQLVFAGSADAHWRVLHLRLQLSPTTHLCPTTHPTIPAPTAAGWWPPSLPSSSPSGEWSGAPCFLALLCRTRMQSRHSRAAGSGARSRQRAELRQPGLTHTPDRSPPRSLSTLPPPPGSSTCPCSTCSLAGPSSFWAWWSPRECFRVAS